MTFNNSNDAGWRRFFSLCAFTSLVVYVLAGFVSTGFLSCDEHFQVLEFLGFKLGKIKASELAWEYTAQSRQWAPTFLYALFIKPLTTFHVTDPYTWALIARQITGVISWVGSCLLGMALPHIIKNVEIRKFSLICVFFIFYLPVLGVRPMSEALAAAMINIAFALIVLGNQTLQRKVGTTAALYCATLFAGAAFLFRYQAAFVILGAGLWCLVHLRLRPFVILMSLILFTAVVLCGVVIDYWGYGTWTFIPWTYFKVQILQGKAAEFGVSPWWSYFSLILQKIPFPVGLLLFLGVVSTWICRPRSILTWSTLPFILGHSAVGHKELRFLIPIAGLSTVMMGCMIEDMAPLWSRFSRRIFKNNPAFFLRNGFIAFNILLLIVFIQPRQPALNAISEINSRYKSPRTLLWQNKNPYEACGRRINFYSLNDVETKEIHTPQDIERHFSTRESILFYRKGSGFPEDDIFLSSACTLIQAQGLFALVPKDWKGNKLSQLAMAGNEYHELYECKPHPSDL